jgi:hypothetical protein
VVFINYRREEPGGHAKRLFHELVKRFGRHKIFMDRYDIPLGVDFTQEIAERLRSCRALVVVIGPKWTSVIGRESRRRLDEPFDWVRIEILAALDRGIPTIPVAVGGAKMPMVDDLPEELRPLARLNGIVLGKTRFGSNLPILFRSLEALQDQARRSKGLNAQGELPDLSGPWLAELAGRYGSRFTVTLNLKQFRDELIGSVTYPSGEARITGAQVQGRRVSFATTHVPQGWRQQGTVQIDGEFVGGDLKLSLQWDGRWHSCVARRVP